MNVKPPRWADRFLEWYCHPELLDEIQGDAYELFYRRAKTQTKKANLYFVWNVLRFFKWRNIRKDRLKNYSPTPTAMFKSYFITGIRSMLRNPIPSAINIIGLSVAIGCAVLVFILEDSFYNLDSMHDKAERIALVVNHVKEGDGAQQLAPSPVPLAEVLKENSAVENVVRLGRGAAAVRVGDKVFNEGIFYGDPDFLSVFSFKIYSGNRDALKNKNQLMLTRDMAIKYFATEDVIGKNISLKFNGEYKQEFTIGGVLENTPANSSMYFDFLVPSAVWEDLNKSQLQDWSKNLSVTFVLFKEGQSFDQLKSSLKTYKEIQNKANPDHPVEYAELLPLTQVAERSYQIEGTLSWSNLPAAMIAFIVTGAFLILLACFNYMNVAVASISTRLKEIGVRKVIGGGKKEIIQQFLVENLVMCTIALILGTLLAYYFLVPGFDSLFPIKVVFEVSSWRMVITFFGALLLFVALISGAYPALYVSSFSAVKILKGKEKFGSKSWFSRTLLTLQFTLSITTIVACLVFAWASFYFEGKDWGYNKDNTIVIQLQNARQFEELKSGITSDKNIITYAGSTYQIGKYVPLQKIKKKEDEYSVSHFPIGFEYLETMNIRLKEGRFFDVGIASDKVESVIVNEAFVKKMGWNTPLKESFMCDSTKRFVVGVVEDFNYKDFYLGVEPAMFTIASSDQFLFFVAKAQAGHVVETSDRLKNEWHRIAPDDPYKGFIQNEVFDRFLNGNKANNKVIYFVSAVSMLLAAMGLYGLVSYNLTRRLREFSVRKVFGANVFQIFRLMNRDYLWILLIAFFVGAPLGGYLMNLMLAASYEESIPNTIWPYVISISTMVLTVGITVLSQLKRVIYENPTETLRSE
jgi:putative ABC transport system permease protein